MSPRKPRSAAPDAEQALDAIEAHVGEVEAGVTGEPVTEAPQDAAETAEVGADPHAEVESPAARARDGGPVVTPARGSVTFKLPRFEGPLDLLLHLIKRDEIDIYDIPIARITQQYLQYIELMRMLDLDVAGEFLVMAATLMRIKAKMLLPVQQPGEEEDEGDPREELVQRLIEYRQFKEAAEQLKNHEGQRRLLYERGIVPTEDDAGPLPLAPATLFDLLEALNRVLSRVPQRVVYEVATDVFDVEDKMSLIARTVAEDGELSFLRLVQHCRARLEIVVSFMALLELIKLGQVIVVQDENFSDIRVLPKLAEEERESHAPVESATGD